MEPKKPPKRRAVRSVATAQLAGIPAAEAR